MNAGPDSESLRFAPATVERWRDLEGLFGARGACGGCWCMYWRLARSVFDRQKGEANREALRALVQTAGSSGAPAQGLLAYAGDTAVAWCAVAPRSEYPALGRSRILAPVDDQPVWSIACFFVARAWRRRGVLVPLIHAAVEYAAAHGARVVEAYPVEPRKGKMPDAFAWTGLATAFLRAGFVEVARRSATRPIMRVSCPPGDR